MTPADLAAIEARFAAALFTSPTLAAEFARVAAALRAAWADRDAARALADRSAAAAVDAARELGTALAAAVRERDEARATLARGNVVDVDALIARLRAATSYCEPGCTKPVRLMGGDVLDVIAAIEHQWAEIGAARTAEDLALTVMGQENTALRAIVEGRDVAPTDDEIAAHHAAGGTWLVAFGARGIDTRNDPAFTRITRSTAPPGTRWWPLDATGRPCAWPVVGGGR